LLNFLYVKYTIFIGISQGKSLEKREKTTKYFTPLVGGGPPGALADWLAGTPL